MRHQYLCGWCPEGFHDRCTGGPCACAQTDHHPGVVLSKRMATSVVPDPGKRVLLLRNAIDLARWTQQDVSMDPPILGWVGHTSYRSRDLEVIAPMVRQYMKAHPEVLFQHSGVDSGSYHAVQVMKLPDPPLTMPVDFESSGIAVGPLHFVQFDSRSRLVEH